MIRSWGDEEDYEIRESLIESVIKRAVSDNLSSAETERLTRNLNLGIGERERIDNMVEIARLTKTASPTKSELRQMVQAKVISIGVWEKQMASRGYSQYWINNYKQLYEI
jgi:hypothetical protein